MAATQGIGLWCRRVPSVNQISPHSQQIIEQLCRGYRKVTGFPVLATDPEGCALNSPKRHAAPSLSRCQAIQEAFRWGEPCVMLDAEGLALWAVPLMQNARLTGGLVVEKISLDAADPQQRAREIRTGCELLMQMAVEHDLTNAAHMELRRLESRREQERAEALHALKDNFYDSIREVYLREEPSLLAAIKRGERPAARGIINRVLVGIYHVGRQRPELLKSLALELVVMMCRAAVEAGADPSEVLGINYDSMSELSRLEDEEELAEWLGRMLERVMDAIRSNSRFPNTVLLAKALAYMTEHLDEEIDRETVARAAGLSVSHFSHLMREKTGRTFTDLMAQYRVDHARALLVRTDKSLVQIALECGFADQSYFTRVFRRYTGKTPRAFRASGATTQDRI